MVNRMIKNIQKELIIGKNAILEAIQANHAINKIFIADGVNKNSIKTILSLAKESKIILKYVPRNKLDLMVQNTNHQGIIAEIAAYEYADFHGLLSDLSDRKDGFPFLIMLDGIEDPHNLGSILRTADVVGVDGIIIPNRRAVGLTGTVAKTSAGAIEYVPVTRVTNLSQALDELKDKGYWIIGTDAFAKQTYQEIDYNMPICLVIGSEGKGISRLIKEKCDFNVHLPMNGHINSLNASVAAALMMYEVFKQRGF